MYTYIIVSICSIISIVSIISIRINICYMSLLLLLSYTLARWLFTSCVGSGPLKMGLPGLAAQVERNALYMCVCIYIYIYMCMRTQMCIYTYIYICIYIHTHMYIYIYTVHA